MIYPVVRKFNSPYGLVTGLAIGGISGGLGGHIVDRKANRDGNWLNRNRGAVIGAIGGSALGGIVGNRIDKQFRNSVNHTKTSFKGKAEDIKEKFDAATMNPKMKKEEYVGLLNQYLKGNKNTYSKELQNLGSDYSRNVRNLALGAAAGGIGAGVTTAALLTKDKMKRNDLSSKS